MRKSYKFKKRTKIEKNFLCNHQIRSPQVQIIDELGKHLGVFSTSQALAMAIEKGLDLVEVSPLANPPVAKIMDFGSFQYQREKILKKQKSQNKPLETKSIRLSLKIGEHDQTTKMKQADKFLEWGHKVKVEVVMRGREMHHVGLARELLINFQKGLSESNQLEQDIARLGNRLFMILRPDKN